MAESIRKRRDIAGTTAPNEPAIATAGLSDPTSDLEVYAKEVLMQLITDNLPPTPNNFSLYFDRLLEDKSESLRKQVNAVLEFEEDNDDEKSIELEKSLKQGFASAKNILQVTASLYKNVAVMTKILNKRKGELLQDPESKHAAKTIDALEKDVEKLNSILKKQIDQMKTHYDATAAIVKNVENETIFDNQYGVYNKRYLISKLEQEANLISEFKHKSTLIMIQLSKTLEREIGNEKAAVLMTRTIARLLLKTSRRSDIVAHYGSGTFAMILKHTDVQSAQFAASRLCDLVASSNFFLAEREIQLKISVGIAEVLEDVSVEETLVCALDAMAEAERNNSIDYAVCSKNSDEDLEP